MQRTSCVLSRYMKSMARFVLVAGCLQILLVDGAVLARSNSSSPVSVAGDQREKGLAKLLIGSWRPDPAKKDFLDGSTTYRADGTGATLIWPHGHPDRVMKIQFKWEMRGDRLISEATSSSNPMVPVGLKLEDRIISISETECVMELGEGHDSDIGKKSKWLRLPPA